MNRNMRKEYREERVRYKQGALVIPTRREEKIWG
jgi:hypothetical protein